MVIKYFLKKVDREGRKSRWDKEIKKHYTECWIIEKKRCIMQEQSRIISTIQSWGCKGEILNYKFKRCQYSFLWAKATEITALPTLRPD